MALPICCHFMTAPRENGAAARLKDDIDHGPDALNATRERQGGAANAAGAAHRPAGPQPGRRSEWTLGGVLWLGAALLAAVAIIAAIFMVRGG